MLGIIEACWALLVGLLASVWGIIELICVWGWDVLYHLHTSAPRLEGLLVGVLLAWVLLRRDRHPLLRVLSAPLKLIVDTLDLAWDQVVEVWGDVWGTTKDWTLKIWSYPVNAVKKSYNMLITGLTKLKDKLSKSEE
jgi:hypothetical protein